MCAYFPNSEYEISEAMKQVLEEASVKMWENESIC